MAAAVPNCNDPLKGTLVAQSGKCTATTIVEKGISETVYTSFTANDPAQPCLGGSIAINKDAACSVQDISFAFNGYQLDMCSDASSTFGPGASATWSCSTGSTGGGGSVGEAMGAAIAALLVLGGAVMCTRSRRASSSKTAMRAGLLNSQVQGGVLSGGGGAQMAPVPAQAYVPPSNARFR
jgi:hypothetical protein